MQLISKLLGNLKIKNKLLILYFISFLAPILIMAFFTTSWLYKTLAFWEMQQAESSFEKTETFFNNIMREVSDLSDRIYVNRTVKSIIQTEFHGTKEVYNAYTNLAFIDEFMTVYNSVSSIRLYTNNETLLDNSFIMRSTPKTENTPWFQKAKKNRGQPFWTYKRDSVTGKYTLSNVRSVWEETEKKFIGVLTVNLNHSYIDKNLDNITYHTFIAQNGIVLFSSAADNSGLKKSAVRKMYIDNNKPDDGISETEIDGKKTGLMKKTFYPSHGISDPLEIFYIIPLDRLNDATTRIVKTVIFVLLECMAFSLMAIFIFSFYIQKRVDKVRYGIKDVVAKKFEIPETIGGHDEFSEIYDAVCDMSHNIKNLIDEVYIRNLEKEQLLARQNDIRFKMLSAQINPHFIFNTLEHIRMKALESSDKDVPHMLRLLAKILRYNLSVSGTSVPLFQEIEIVNNYLEIQHKRFENRISYDIMLLCDARKINILPLLIQPIIENSFSHGLESKISGGFIYIIIRTETAVPGKNELIITIQDNGCGIEKDKLEALNNKLRTTPVEEISTSIGLVNVNQRIKLYYGSEYGLTITSTAGEGTSITIRLPVTE